MLPEHIGDGAYISETSAGVAITAGHHEPHLAAEVVYIDDHDLKRLIDWINRREALRAPKEQTIAPN